MFSKRFFCLLLSLLCVLGICGTALAAEVECDATYCFTAQDFTLTDEALSGICITGLPQAEAGTMLLGNRVLRTGDILTADQLAQMTFMPLRTQQDAQAQLTYLPIYENRVETSATMTIGIRGKEDKIPVATDSNLETYKNLPNEGTLSATDPEGQALTYTLVRAPKRGQVELRENGSFLYTPKKNKVGVDSFVFTATDPAGNVSRQATVTVQILKPSQSQQYSDTAGKEYRFEAEWLRNTGLFVGESVNGQSCFHPEKAVSRGQFLAMVVNMLDIPLEEVAQTALPQDTPQWLAPYLAAAMRAGLTAGIPEEEGDSLDADAPITGAEAAVLLQNALDLTVSSETLEEKPTAEQEMPTWAESSLAVMAQYGITLEANAPITRADAAQVLYQVSALALEAPGTAVFRMQE
jgi:hypothetical protein